MNLCEIRATCALRTKLAQKLPLLWFLPRFSPLLLPLLPFSWLFRGIVFLRRFLYQNGFLSIGKLPVPVIVVGNITAGGAGKTPLVLWLAQKLCEQGFYPAIISRGYGRKSEENADKSAAPREVLATDNAQIAGDEPLLLAQKITQSSVKIPVFVGQNRLLTAQKLLEKYPHCNVIISDDGLQHYRLPRVFEFAVLDQRGIGNAHFLPAGALREPVSRLQKVAAIVGNLPESTTFENALPFLSHIKTPKFTMRLKNDAFYALNQPQKTCSADYFADKKCVAIAGIGNPARFFNQLRAAKLQFSEHAFADHQNYTRDDFAFAQHLTLLMTEKDAVKCAPFADQLPNAWVLPVTAHIEDEANLLTLIVEKLHGFSPT